MERITTAKFLEKKRNGEKITVLTAYDFLTAMIVDEAGVDGILVGDSLGMVVLGYSSTIPVTMEEMIHHTKAVVRGRKRALVIFDMPFLSYQTGIRDAILNAGRALKETGCDAVKVEGGVEQAETIRALVNSGIPVMGHVGLQPQSVNVYGGYKLRGRGEERKRIIEDAKAVEEAGASAVSLINTLLGMAIDIKRKRPVLGNVFGGLSGPAIKPVALRMVWQVARCIKIPVIGIGGITTPADALEFLMAGACAVQVGTASLVDPVACSRVLSGIVDFMAENNYQSIDMLKIRP